MRHLERHPYLVSLLAALLSVAGFAPLYLFPLPLIALALLFWIWQRAAPRVAALSGLAYGVGLFGAGMGWIYIALHDHGHMPWPLAMLATALFVLFFAAFYVLPGYLQAKMRLAPVLHFTLLLPALWTAGELLRGYLFTGLPWLTLGYAQVPHSPLAGYAPIIGVYGVSWLLAVSAGLFAWWLEAGRTVLRPVLAGMAALWLGGAALSLIAWTAPEGEPLKVALLQGNIAQEDKFDPQQLPATLETYRRLAESSDARLIVLPETALPMLRQEVPVQYEGLLSRHVRQNGGDVLIGSFEKEEGRYYNSVYSLGSAPGQHYRKEHLVPFGEFIPLRSVFGWLINEVLDIPMGDLSRGGAAQAPLEVAGQRVAVNICYEDVFGEELIRALPQATLLVNVTNDAWYGRSHAASQHNQIAQMRARETGRMMLRATNTGVTAVIGVDGRVEAMLPQHEEGVLEAVVQGYGGSTPYARWGNLPVGLLLAGVLLWCGYRTRR